MKNTDFLQTVANEFEHNIDRTCKMNKADKSLVMDGLKAIRTGNPIPCNTLEQAVSWELDSDLMVVQRKEDLSDNEIEKVVSLIFN